MGENQCDENKIFPNLKPGEGKHTEERFSKRTLK
jgi:hypothetical protein